VLEEPSRLPGERDRDRDRDRDRVEHLLPVALDQTPTSQRPA
jgi:hypothetical protein